MLAARMQLGGGTRIPKLRRYNDVTRSCCVDEMRQWTAARSVFNWFEAAKLDRFWLEFSALIPPAGRSGEALKASRFSDAQKAFILK